MNPIYKFNNGRGATLCHLCRTIITVGKPTNDLYCDRCLNERNSTEAEFLRLKANLKKLEQKINWPETTKNAFDSKLQNKHLFDETGQWITPEENETWKKFFEQMDTEVHFNRGNLGV